VDVPEQPDHGAAKRLVSGELETTPKLVVWFSRVQVTNMWDPQPPFTFFRPPWAASEVESSGTLKCEMSMVRMEQNLKTSRYRSTNT